MYHAQMRILAFILGLVACAGTSVVMWSYARAARGEKLAVLGQERAASDAHTWEAIAERKLENEQQQVSNDELAIDGDDVRLRIASLQGSGLAQARQQKSLDEDRLSSSRLALRLYEDLLRLGPDEHVRAAADRHEACREALDVWSETITRDIHLAYALLGAWIAFGFAVAFAARN